MEYERILGAHIKDVRKRRNYNGSVVKTQI